MSLGSWDPNEGQSHTGVNVNPEYLARFISLSESDQLDKLENALSKEEQQSQAHIMHMEKHQWFEIAQSYSDDQITHLIRFFTKAEQLAGWESGDKSPVIWLAKVLKQRGVGIERDLVLWIKANSDNRFLPHGPLL